MANKSMKRWSTSFLLRKKELKPLQDTTTSLGKLNLRTLTILNPGKEMCD